jgi:cysteinyl-tRNA synthetase
LNLALRFLGIWNGETTNEIYSFGIKVGDGPNEWDIRPLVDARAAARARKDFKESDRIRDELAAMGVVLKDGKDADGKPMTTWEIAR